MADHLDAIIEDIRRDLNALRVQVGHLESSTREYYARSQGVEQNILYRLNRLEADLDSFNQTIEHHERQLIQLDTTVTQWQQELRKDIKSIVEILMSKKDKDDKERTGIASLSPREWAAIILGILTLATIGTELLRLVLNRLPPS